MIREKCMNGDKYENYIYDLIMLFKEKAKEKKINKDKIILELFKDELKVLCKVLDEVCNGIEV